MTVIFDSNAKSIDEFPIVGGKRVMPTKVQASVLPAGAATEAKQDGILTELEGKADLDEIQPVSQVDENGETYGVKHIDNKPRVSSMPYTYDIAEGNVAGHEAIRRFGHNGNVGTAWETVYNGSDLKTYLTSGERLQVVSTDVEDDGAPVGDGARTILVEGLDDDYKEISETVIMNGTTNVLTAKTYLRVKQISVVTAGDTGYNEGIITISNNADSAVLEHMAIQANKSLCACFTVPAGYTAYITQAMATESSNKGCHFGFWIRVLNGFWTMQREIVLINSSIVVPMVAPMKLPQKTDIEIRAMGQLAAADVTAGFEGWVEAN